MMESSEQCALNGSADPDESPAGTEGIVATNYENYAGEDLSLNQVMENQITEQVVGYLDEESATLVLQSQGLELNGKRLILAQGTAGNEILVFVSTDQDAALEHSFVQSITDSDGNHTFAIECGSNNLEAISGEGIQRIQLIGANDLQNIDKNETLFIQQAQALEYLGSDNNHYSSEALGNTVCQVQEKDATAEMVFIPTESQVISAGNTRLLHLADVAHSEWSTSETHDKDAIEFVKKVNEGSVIVRGIRARVDSDFCKEGEMSINAVNDQANNNSLQDEHMIPEIETSSPGVEGESLLLSIPPRDINNAVSVIITSSPGLSGNESWRTVNIQESEELTKETCQPDVKLPSVSTDIINIKYANLKETQCSDLSSQNTFIEESSNHSHLKDSTDCSNKDDTANYKAHAVEEPMDEDTNESIPLQLTSSKNIDEDDSEQKDSISCSEDVSQLKDSISCSEDVSQLKDSISCSEDVSHLKDSISCSEDVSQIKDSINCSEDVSQLEDSISCSEDVSQLEDSISCNNDTSKPKDNNSCNAIDSKQNDSINCIENNSKQEYNLNLNEDDSKRKDDISPNENVSKQKDNISPNEDDSEQKDNTNSSENNPKQKDCISCSENISQLRDSISPIEDVSQLKDSTSLSEDDSKQRKSIICKTDDLKQKDSIISNENYLKQKYSIISNEDDMRQKDSIISNEDDLKEKDSISCNEEDSKQKDCVICSDSDSNATVDVDQIENLDNKISYISLKNFENAMKQNNSINCNNNGLNISMNVDEIQNLKNTFSDPSSKNFENEIKQIESIGCNDNDLDISMDVHQIQNLDNKISDSPSKNYEAEIKQKDSIISCSDNDSDTSVDFDQIQNLENKISDSSSKNYENEIKQNESFICNDNDLDISMDVDQIQNLNNIICDSPSKNYEAEIKQKDSIISCNDNDSDTSVDVDQIQNLDSKISDPSSKNYDIEIKQKNNIIICNDNDSDTSVEVDQIQNLDNKISDPSSKNYEVEIKQNGSISCSDNDSGTSVDVDQIQNLDSKISDPSSKNYDIEIKQKDSIIICNDNDSDTSVEVDQIQNLDNKISDPSSKSYEVEIKQNGSISCSDSDSDTSVDIDQMQNLDNKISDPSSKNYEVEIKQNGSISCSDNDSDTSVDIDQVQNLDNNISDPSLKSCEIEIKQKDSIDCNDNDSDTLIATDQIQISDSKISDPSSYNGEKEIESTNFEEACSDIQTCPESPLLSHRDNSKSVSSSFSINSQSKDHNLNKLNQLQFVSSSKLKKAIDEYEFENSSSNLDAEMNHNISLNAQASDTRNSTDINTENDVTEVSQIVNSVVEDLIGNLTFHRTLTPVTDSIKLNQNPACNENNETSNDNSQDLFDQDLQNDEKNYSRKMLKNIDEELLKNKQNSGSVENNHTDQIEKSEETSVVKSGVSNDSKRDKSNNMNLNLAASDETTVKTPQRTYVRKRRISDTSKNIELFSLDELSGPKDEISSHRTPKIFCPDNQKKQIRNDENNLTDEDGYVNLISSDMTNRIKAKGTSPPMDDRRIRSLRPRSSDHMEKIPEHVKDTEDSVSTCWGAYLMETSFKPSNAEKMEEDAPKVSSLDASKEESPKNLLKKRIRTPSYKKINTESDSYKSGRQWDKLIKSSPVKIRDASSDKRKIREKVKKQVEKTLRNSENFNSSPISKYKKGRLSKLSKACKTVLCSTFPSPHEKIKTCGIRFLNDNSTEKNNSSAVDDLSIPSTSTQDLNNFQYNCTNCSFVSNKVNNFIIHMKYCTFKSSTNMIDYRVDDMERRQRIRGDFTENNSTAKKKSLSGMIDFRFSDKERRQQIHGDFSESDSSIEKPSSGKIDYRFNDMERRQRIRGDSSEIDSSVEKSSNVTIDYRFSYMGRKTTDFPESDSPVDKHSTDGIDYQVNDMERRQRIRGDIFGNDIPVECSSTSQNFSNVSLVDYYENASVGSENDDEGEMEVVEEEPKPREISNKKKYGYKENEIVWALVNDRFWPALVHKIDHEKVVLYFIDRPNKEGTSVTNVHMNVPINELPSKVHTFNDAKWNKQLLTDAGELPDNDIFVKAVQKADSYIRKRFLYDADIDGFAYFGVRRNVEYADGVDIADINVLEENIYVNKETIIDMKEVVQAIYQGRCDQHVVDVYQEIIKSDRHIFHCTRDGKNLKQLSWFGPFKQNPNLQIKLHDYFINLFKSKFGPKKDVSSYIYEVWIPEAIIKAISLIKHVSLLEAQIVFFSQDMQSLGEDDFAAETGGS
ncbi:Lysostaphin like protein [Argiope bruennichi]|uniref:Lysostaphin like protein n=1 Tax=Argiope bruennichi TaxID=94029 RepID=A0A8T0G025_ARGBR|nr:Lysostaphin like protein [Argiope bruennichi]